MDLALFAGLLVGAAFGVVVGFALATGRQAGLIARARAAEEKLAYAEERMAEHFENLSARALDASNERFLELADARLKAAGVEAAGELERRKQAVEHLVTPLRETLAKVEEQLREVETGRRESHAMLAKQVEFVRQSSDQLRNETRTLVRALQRPEARGRWGELQLRRVVELAGMTHHCDFDEQATAVTVDRTVRPDMVVRLVGDKNIVVDSKVSLAAYLEAAATDDPAAERALYERLGTLGQHMDELGRSLTNAVRSYNRSVGSLETRVLVSARRLNELGVVENTLDGPEPIEESPRSLSAAELDAPSPPDRTDSVNGHVGDEDDDARASDGDGDITGQDRRPRPDAGAEPVGFGRRAIPDQVDRQERWQ
jgi:DNA anti-recombination protein RmuC